MTRTLAVAFALAACKSPRSPATVDAIQPDSATDAAVLDAPVDAVTGRITLTLYADDGSDTPVGGGIVLAHAADATFFARTVTAGDGTATIDVPLGGSITVIRPRTDAPGINASTILDLVGPLQLDLGWKTPSPGALLGQMRVAVPDYVGASTLIVFNGCDSQAVSGGFAFVRFYSGCQRASYDIVAIAYAADGTALASSEIDAQPFVNNGSVTIPNAYVAAQSFMFSVSDLPPSQNQYRIARTERRAGLPYSLEVGEFAPLQSTSFSATMQIAAPATEMEVRIESTSVGFGYPRLERDRIPSATTYSTSGTVLLEEPYIEQVDGTAAVWMTAEPGATDAAGLYVRGELFHATTTDRWLLVSNARHDAILFPVMPPDISLHASPSTEDEHWSVGLYRSDQSADYAAFVVEADREHALRFRDLDTADHVERSGNLAP